VYKPQIKHKAEHGGYRHKPTKGEVNGLLSLYQGISQAVVKPEPKPIQKAGVQLKLLFS